MFRRSPIFFLCLCAPAYFAESLVSFSNRFRHCISISHCHTSAVVIFNRTHSSFPHCDPQSADELAKTRSSRSGNATSELSGREEKSVKRRRAKRGEVLAKSLAVDEWAHRRGRIPSSDFSARTRKERITCKYRSIDVTRVTPESVTYERLPRRQREEEALRQVDGGKIRSRSARTSTMSIDLGKGTRARKRSFNGDGARSPSLVAGASSRSPADSGPSFVGTSLDRAGFGLSLPRQNFMRQAHG